MDVLRVIEGAHDRAATVGIHQENRSSWTKAIVGHVFDACSNGFGYCLQRAASFKCRG
jgi:hypothetical protein